MRLLLFQIKEQLSKALPKALLDFEEKRLEEAVKGILDDRTTKAHLGSQEDTTAIISVERKADSDEEEEDEMIPTVVQAIQHIATSLYIFFCKSLPAQKLLTSLR